MAKKLTKAKSAEILHDRTSHGKKLTEKQRKFFAWKAYGDLGIEVPNANKSSIKLPENFNGSGYTSYNWESPAWGGQFQMGGNIPGAVGFTYARTSSTPSEGKYAKKTKPSAQNGTNLFPVETWKSQGLNSADTLRMGTMYRMPYTDLNKIYNIPIPKGVNPNDIGYITTDKNPNSSISKLANKPKNVSTYDISGVTTSASHPQDSLIKSFETGGSMSPYWINGLDFKPKSMQDGGDIQLKRLLLQERQNKRDSVLGGLLKQFPKAGDYSKVQNGMLNYYQVEPKEHSTLDINLLSPQRKKQLLKQAKGGKIKKDNLGYLNPENKGKPVEIGSNLITMYGVEEPILGISNTGQSRMMYPNNNYAFDGTSVTEYPIEELTKSSKQDKGQQKKLTQLTDFSNNNNMEQGKSGIFIKPSKRGTFTTAAKKRGQSVQGFASKVLANKSNYSTAMVKKANFARNSKKWKHEEGGVLPLAQYGFSMDDIAPNNSINLLPQNNGVQSFPQQNVDLSGQLNKLSGGFTPYNVDNSGNPAQQYNNINVGPNPYSTLGKIGGLEGGLNIAGNFIKGAKMLNQDTKQRQNARQFAAVSDVVAQAASSRPQPVKRKYVRPEDMIVQPGQLGNPYGAGTTYFHDGGEIANTYAPKTLYNDLGYEPLDDSNQIKKFQLGGIAGAIGSGIGGGTWTPSGGSQIGSTLGGVAGSIIPGVGTVLGSVAGGLIGGLFDAGNQSKIRKYTREGQNNLQRAAIQEGIQNTQTQYSAFMEEGGDINPSIIKYVGDHNISGLLKPDPMMNTLRTGGSIRQNYPSEFDNFNLGGDLITHWGGKADTLSINPYLPDTGETVMFKGNTHSETDGKGNTGIGVTYGNSPVEVENNEPAIKLNNDNLVVFGNMKIPNYGVAELNDKNAKNKKFKSYITDLSNKEERANNTIDKATKLAKNSKDVTSFDQLSLSTAKAMLDGSNMKLKDIAEKKKIAASVQNAILDTAREHNLDSEALSKGQIKKAKKGAYLGYNKGGYIPKAQASITIPKDTDNSMAASIFGYGDLPIFGKDSIKRADVPKALNYGFTEIPEQNKLKKDVLAPKKGSQSYEDWFKENYPKNKGKIIDSPWGKMNMQLASPSTQYLNIKDEDTPYDISLPPSPLMPISSIKGSPSIDNIHTDSSAPQSVSNSKSPINALNAASSMFPYFRPTNQIGLDPTQLSGEMFALASNQLEPVQAQLYYPQLDQPYDISLQDQVNTNQSTFNDLRRQVSRNPAALSVLAGQKYAADSNVLGEQMRINQANKAQIYSKNRDTINDARLKNLAILDQQYSRQAQAKSATKAVAQQALSSIADKIMQNKLENRRLGILENLYGYRYDNQGRAYNLNAPYQFNIPQITPVKSKDGSSIKKKNTNGHLVKLLK